MNNAQLKKGFQAQARSLREFGYPSVTAELVAEHHAAWKRGENRPTDVIFMFNKKAFEDYTEIFGEPDKE